MAPKPTVVKRPASKVIKKRRIPTPESGKSLTIKLPLEDARAAALVPKLSSEATKVRRKAAEDMIALGKAAIPSLQRVLVLGTSNNLRGWAANQLRKVALEDGAAVAAAVPVLLQALDDQYKFNGYAAAEALLAIGQPAATDVAPSIRKFAKLHPEYRKLTTSLRSLTKSTVLKRPASNDTTLEQATVAGSTENQVVDPMAAARCQRDGSSDGDAPPLPAEDRRTAALVSQLTDDDADVRRAAGQKLTDFGPIAIPSLQRVIQECKSRNVRNWAVGVIKKLAAEKRRSADAAVPSLVVALNDTKVNGIAATEALLCVGKPAALQAVPHLRTFLAKYPDLQERFGSKLEKLSTSD